MMKDEIHNWVSEMSTSGADSNNKGNFKCEPFPKSYVFFFFSLDEQSTTMCRDYKIYFIHRFSRQKNIFIWTVTAIKTSPLNDLSILIEFTVALNIELCYEYVEYWIPGQLKLPQRNTILFRLQFVWRRWLTQRWLTAAQTIYHHLNYYPRLLFESIILSFFSLNCLMVRPPAISTLVLFGWQIENHLHFFHLVNIFQNNVDKKMVLKFRWIYYRLHTIALTKYLNAFIQ